MADAVVTAVSPVNSSVFTTPSPADDVAPPVPIVKLLGPEDASPDSCLAVAILGLVDQTDPS